MVVEQEYLYYVLIFFVLEFIELQSQKGDTLKAFMLHHQQTYIHNPLTYIALHISFFFMIYIVISTELLNFWVLGALSLKCADVVFKLYLIDRISKEGEAVIDQLTQGTDIRLTPGIKYFSLFLYTFMLYMGLS